MKEKTSQTETAAPGSLYATEHPAEKLLGEIRETLTERLDAIRRDSGKEPHRRDADCDIETEDALDMIIQSIKTYEEGKAPTEETKPYIYWLLAAWENQDRKCAKCRQELPLENSNKIEGSVLLFCPECAATFPKSPERMRPS